VFESIDAQLNEKEKICFCSKARPTLSRGIGSDAQRNELARRFHHLAQGHGFDDVVAKLVKHLCTEDTIHYVRVPKISNTPRGLIILHIPNQI
jgi:hypothetical protein